MASLMRTKSVAKKKARRKDGWAVQFVGRDRKRRTIRLGAINKGQAETILAKVAALNVAAISQTSWDGETAAWVGGRDAILYSKLAAVGLVPKRAEIEHATLGRFLEAYISGRTDVKEATATAYSYTQSGLLAKFGADKPLAEITAGDADEFRRWLAEPKGEGKNATKGLGENTVRRRCGIARQFFRAAVRKRLITENPFAEMKGVSVRSNRARDYFLTRQDAAKVLDACPDAEWRLIFALSRFGGLRCPSETLRLQWADIDWANNRFTVTSPKTEHHEGHGTRVVPLFPELRPYFEDAFDPEAVFVIARYRHANVNLRTQLERIIKRAGLTPWEKLFQNLRATRATELAAQFPSHVAAEWLGHSTMVAQEHYWRTTEDDFEKAASGCPDALHIPVQQPAASGCNEENLDTAFAGTCESPGVSGGDQLARKDSNLK